MFRSCNNLIFVLKTSVSFFAFSILSLLMSFNCSTSFAFLFLIMPFDSSRVSARHSSSTTRFFSQMSWLLSSRIRLQTMSWCNLISYFSLDSPTDQLTKCYYMIFLQNYYIKKNHLKQRNLLNTG